MAISINRLTNVIFVPQADLTFISGTLYELDTDQFRKDLKLLEEAEEGMVFDDTHAHNTEYTVAGVTYARAIFILLPYTVEFEDGQYAVRLVGSNNDIFDEGIIVRNQVSIIPTNSAGLQIVQSANKVTETHIGTAYDKNTTTVLMSVFLEKLGATVLTPTSCKVDWFNPDGTLLFTISDSSPDTQGIFQLSVVEALLANTAYYAEVTVTDVIATMNTWGVPTGP